MHFKHKNGATRYTHIKVGRIKSYFSSDPLNGDNKYTASDICKMFEFMVDDIYVEFGGQLFRQTVGIPLRTNCAPLVCMIKISRGEGWWMGREGVAVKDA